MSDAIRITGATRLYPIIGDPIAQVRSPEVFSARFAAAGTPAVCIPVHVPSERFETIVAQRLAILRTTLPPRAHRFCEALTAAFATHAVAVHG